MKTSPTRAALVVLAGLLSLALGCDADCRDVCRKLVKECDYGEPGFGLDQCEGECQLQVDDLEAQPDATAESEALQVQMNCVVEAECSDLLDPASAGYPACYDPQVSVF